MINQKFKLCCVAFLKNYQATRKQAGSENLLQGNPPFKQFKNCFPVDRKSSFGG